MITYQLSIKMSQQYLVWPPRELVIGEHDIVETSRAVDQHSHPLVLRGYLRNLNICKI